MLRKGVKNVHVVNRARILLKVDKGFENAVIARDVFVSTKTVSRIRARYVSGGLERALNDLPRSGQPPIITESVEAYLVAIACSAPPDGRDHWTMKLLRQKLLDEKKVKRISTVAILKRLRKRGIKPWREKNVVHPDAQR